MEYPLKIGSKVVFKRNNGTYISLWHYQQEIQAYASRWSANIEGMILRKKEYYNV